MKKLYTLFMLMILASYSIAQTEPASADTSLWKKGGVATISLSQSSFTNWAAGGENNMNLSSLVSLFANRKTVASSWENNLDMGFGIQKLSDAAARKSEDKIELNSKYGIKMSEKTNYAVLFNAKSQFADGYVYTDTSKTYVSTFLSPGYFSLAIGIDYKPKENLSLFFSPIGGKITTVLDDSLAAQGAYGVDTGKNIRFELGASASIKYQAALATNVLLKSKLDFFAGYANIQSVDISWENLVAFQINKLLTATLSTNLIYDEDILIPKDKEVNGVVTVENKPRVQFKQVFALGVTYKF